MIDLNNCWCEATEENYIKLVELGYKISESQSIFNTFSKIKEDDEYLDNDILGICHNTFIWTDNNDKKGYRQIHLVNGEFEYVEEIKESRHDVDVSKECQFKKYGFQKPDFECEIFKKIGKYVFGYLKTNDWSDNEYISCSWDENGVLNSDFIEEGIYEELGDVYKLKPIKKEWYEDENIKDKLIINKYGEVRKVQYISNGKVATHQSNLYKDAIKVDGWRLATKEEILNLLVEEDNDN